MQNTKENIIRNVINLLRKVFFREKNDLETTTKVALGLLREKQLSVDYLLMIIILQS